MFFFALETINNMIKGVFFVAVTIIGFMAYFFAFMTLYEVHEFIKRFKKYFILLIEEFGMSVFTKRAFGTET